MDYVLNAMQAYDIAKKEISFTKHYLTRYIERYNTLSEKQLKHEIRNQIFKWSFKRTRASYNKKNWYVMKDDNWIIHIFDIYSDRVQMITCYEKKTHNQDYLLKNKTVNA